MNTFSELFKKEHIGEFVLVILMSIYLIMGFKTPDVIAGLVDNMVGKIVIILVVFYLFMHSNPILAVVAALVAYDLMKKSAGANELQKFAPSEKKKMSQFSAYNQFPYTLEQEVVAKMAPIVRSGVSLSSASYKPMLDNNHDATPLNGSN